MKTPSTLAAVAGLGGAVGSTFAAGVCLPPGELKHAGLVTESPLVRAIGKQLMSLDALAIDGWDLHLTDLYTACCQHSICPDEVLRQVEPQLRAITPRPGIDLREDHIGTWIRREADYLRARQEEEGFDHVMIINLCPTEPLPVQQATSNIEWNELKHLGAAKVQSVSAVYLRLAIEARAHFINFTPNAIETTSLRSLAEDARLIYAGRDGKTGQTFIKTTLAPAFRDKNLHIDGWFSTNLLGNADGMSLAGTEAGRAKILSKSRCLSSILGYEPGGQQGFGHQVHIHYYPPRGDAKEAWDSIDFHGFLGVRMQMKINWLGQDSILAAPAVIDLIRIVTFAAEAGFHGPLDPASYFFKDPVVRSAAVPQHGVPEQFGMLLNFLRKGEED